MARPPRNNPRPKTVNLSRETLAQLTPALESMKDSITQTNVHMSRIYDSMNTFFNKQNERAADDARDEDLSPPPEPPTPEGADNRTPTPVRSDNDRSGGAGLLGLLGGKVAGGVASAGVLLAGAGLLAGGAGMFLKELNNMDVDAIKANVKGLLSIQDDFGGAGKFFMAAGPFVLAMTGIGLGLAVFGAGSAVAGMSDKLLDKYATNWAEGVKENVVTLLSIKDELGGNLNMLADGGAFMLAMTGIAGGLAVFGAGSAVIGLSANVLNKFTDGNFATSIKENVLTLLSIGDARGGNSDFLKDSAGFLGAMTGIGLGLAVFGAGSAAAGLTSNVLDLFGKDGWAQSIKDNVAILLSIGDAQGGNIEFLKDSAGFLGAMSGIGLGLAVFGGATLIKALADFFAKDQAQSTKDQVLTLLSIGDEVTGDPSAKAQKVADAMGILGGGLSSFAGGSFVATLKQAGSSILGFLTGAESPVEQLLKIADKQEEIDLAATGIDKMSVALEKLGSIKINTPKFDLESMLDSFGHLPKLLEGLTKGNPKGKPIEFETSMWNKEIDFGNGILNNEAIDLAGLAVAMGQVRELLGSEVAPAQSVSAQAGQRLRGGPKGASDTTSVQVVSTGGNSIGAPNVTNVTNNYVTNNYAAKVPANMSLVNSGHSK
jgi:hypothetical protein